MTSKKTSKKGLAPITDNLRGLGTDLWSVHFESRRRIGLGESIIELTIGEPDVPTPDVLVDVTDRSMRSGRTGYSPGRGEESMLAAVASYYSRRSGREVTTKSVIALPGVQAGLAFSVLSLTTVGDDVLVPLPCYATYEGVARVGGGNFVGVPMTSDNGFHLTAEQVERSITPSSRVLLLNSPHNPTGATLDRDELFAIGEVCSHHNVWIICDEVYEHLVYPPHKFCSLFDFPDFADRVIVLSSLSKSHAAPGFRCGWCVGPEDFVLGLQPVAEIFLFGNQPFIADMATYALTHPSDCSSLMLSNYRQRIDILTKKLDGSCLVPLVPDGGMFMLVDISGTGYGSSLSFAMDLLEAEGVAVMPGESFGGCADNFVRLSLTNSLTSIEHAGVRLVRFASSCEQKTSKSRSNRGAKRVES